MIPEGYAPLTTMGEGAIAKVVKCLDTRSGDIVALKILKDITDDDDVKRLGVEIESISRVRHPNIVTFITHGNTKDGAPYVVMEWLDGENLRDLLEKEESLDIMKIIEITLQILNALEACHRKSIVHRDLKPENVMLCGTNRDKVKLIDFGMAKLLLDGTDLTIDGQLFGTPQYLAPERITGSCKATQQTDIYSLGIMIYEMAAGFRPFDGEDAQAILRQHLSERPKPLSSVALGELANPLLSQLVRRMMRQTPDQRPSATSLLSEFRKLRQNLLNLKSGSV
ncbi:serine/threonine protein kinase [Myxococcota bacterium]|nr:serine/threonine protein kinase [Myxococcota bacterium]MBU1380736.1 serine/threonine protein kinase [Myxococcota bacterium]MBU1498036.1 serine/threonine protein kinase [Myxococcota bacterium]